eukprot:CAMPEP_0117523282 /NCGR_PEP_ID=MMETSP0784-20121206/34647_1 /TAXON_ID=39447 /ORGANISM="" /LENGTH=283 /DNA_ID=CAMNT_0005319389 /DNA_START=14 /DNA_END=865 /DNA_ORIENTATION=-
MKVYVLASFASVALQSGVAAPRNKRDGPPRTELAHACSRQVSRDVRKNLDKEVLKPATQAKADPWSLDCPFNPALDLWGRHEQNKQRKRGQTQQWTCGICGKVFRSEHYMDLHFERKHMNETPKNGVCLADFCEVFEVCQSETKYRRRRDRDVEPACDNSTMLKARLHCEDAMAKCFPLGHQVSRTFHAKLTRQWCRVLDCRMRAEQKREHLDDLLPAVVLLFFIVLVGFIIFSVVVCCVDYSDDIFQFIVDSGLASASSVSRMTKVREKTRQTIGMERTKGI